MRRVLLLASAVLAVASSSFATADNRMVFRDHLDPEDALEQMVTSGGSLGMHGPLDIDTSRRVEGRGSLVAGRVDGELRVTKAFRPALGAHSVSVYFFVRDHARPDAWIEIGHDGDDEVPVRIGVDSDAGQIVSGPGLEMVLPAHFESGWVELTLHRDGDRLRAFARDTVLAEWTDARAWKSVSLVREGPADAFAWFDDLRVYEGDPDFLVRVARDEARRGRRPRVGFRVGASPVVDPSDVDPGTNFELDFTLDVRASTRVGVQAGLQNGSILGSDETAQGDVWLFGVLAEQALGSGGAFARGEVGIGRVDEAGGSRFGWYGAALGFRWTVAPRLQLVPSIGIRRFETDTAILEVPVALTLRWANQLPGTARR